MVFIALSEALRFKPTSTKEIIMNTTSKSTTAAAAPKARAAKLNGHAPQAAQIHAAHESARESRINGAFDILFEELGVTQGWQRRVLTFLVGVVAAASLIYLVAPIIALGSVMIMATTASVFLAFIFEITSFLSLGYFAAKTYDSVTRFLDSGKIGRAASRSKNFALGLIGKAPVEVSHA